MNAVMYEFNKLNIPKQAGYIFQHVKNRKLTDIYHAHDFYELVCFLEGSATQMVNAEQLRFNAGDMLLLRPGDRHCFIKQNDRTEIISLSVKAEAFRFFAGAYDLNLLKTIDNAPNPVFGNVPPQQIKLAFSGDFKDVCVSAYKLLLSLFLYSASKTVYRETVQNDRKSALPSALQDMLNEENLKEGVQAVIRLTNYSHSHLARLIKKQYGTSLKQYINELRLQHAYKEIVMTNRNIENIAESVGFSSFSHFSKIFKSRFSITPSMLRKKNNFWTI